jgi:anti-sigma regulatory factor (Ser/Thr protein kinase)
MPATRRRPGLTCATAGSRDPPRSRVRLTCAPEIEAPARSRDVAVRTFRRWDLPEDLIRVAEIVVSELVTNAVRHAGTPAHLVLQRHPRYLHVAVRDESPDLPQRAEFPTGLAETGRGLHIVSMLATRWGVLPSADGKAVWATFHLPR